jgi:cytochrome c oxidase accessory protein FixG
VSGRWATYRRVVYALLVVFWAALPWIPVGGHPAVFLDIEKRQFFLFGLTANAQDIPLMFFAITGLGFGLLYLTALLGRVWCGWACPQTVFIESLFRPLERLINGPRNAAMKRADGPMTFDRGWRTALTHAAYVVAAVLVAHVFLAYFVSLPKLFAIVRTKPSEHPEAFAWMLGTTALFYVNFGHFREQFCVVMCPYGRLQSVLLDDDSLVVGYDEKRGEPRGKGKREPATATQATAKGDCVDCHRCVVVCPTGIDIRDGLQLDCIACTACIDACDEVMEKVGRPTGLIRYDSLNGLRGEKRRVLRPRVYAYTGLLVLGVVVATTFFAKRTPFEANILRLPGIPYTRENGNLRNAFEVHLVNKESTPVTFTLEPVGPPDMTYVMSTREVTLDGLGQRRVPIFVTMEQAKFTGDRPVVVRIMPKQGGKVLEAKATFLGARGGT